MFLKAAPAAAVVAALPAAAFATESSPLSAMIEVHKAALAAELVAYDAEDAAFEAYYAALDACPVLVLLPGIMVCPNGLPSEYAPGLGRLVDVRKLSADSIADIYAHYGFHSQKGGARLVGGKFELIDVSAEQARDHAAALDAFAAAEAAMQETAVATGYAAASDRATAADAAAEAALLAVLSYTPCSAADGALKTSYVLPMLDSDGYGLPGRHVEALVRSFGGAA